MRNRCIEFLAIAFISTSQLTNPASADSVDPAAAVQELAALNADLVNISTILRISEDIAFWQSVALLGAEHDWEFEYSLGGDERYQWTLRLYNSLDETLTEGIAAARDLARSRALNDDEKRAVQELFNQYESMRATGEQMYHLILDGDVGSAADLYEAEVIQLRRDITTDGGSIYIAIRNRVRQIALDVRLGN
jgi:hypothetical protein